MSLHALCPKELPANAVQTVDGEASDEGRLGYNWQTAARILLNAAGYADELPEMSDPQDLVAYLEPFALRLEKTEIIRGIIPASEGRIGFLLGLANGNWLSVHGDGESAVLLSEDGKALGPYVSLPPELIKNVWSLNERLVDLKSIGAFLQRYKGHFIDLFIAGIVVNVFGLTLPLFSSFVYDKILGNGIYETLWALVIGLAIVMGIESCVRMLRINIAERFSVGSEVDIDHAMFSNLLNVRANKIPGVGILLEKYKQILSFRDFLSSSYVLALADLPFLLLFLAAITVVSGPLVFVPLICGMIMLAATYFTTNPILDYERLSRNASACRFGLMTDLMAAREAVIGSALRDTLSERWRQASVASVQTSSKARYWRGLGMTIAGSISYISFIGILVGGVYMVEAQTLTSGGLLAASLLTSRTMGAFSSVNMLLLRYKEFKTAMRELNALIVASDVRAPSTEHHGRLQGAIRFDKVTCRLRDGDMPVLDGISLHIQPGEIVGIAGAPGAGKTTLLRLIAGVLDPDGGRVLIDNIPVDQLSPEDVSLNIGFKPQEFCLLDGTIEDNIRAGREPLTSERRQDVLVTSGLLRIFNEGALNWMTDVGARGSALSGGQRQLVSLARAFFNRPPLIMLDEPTNGLDAALEGHLASQIAAMRGQSTVLVSTHSRNILSICDRIVVVGKSKILADGPRDKILV